MIRLGNSSKIVVLSAGFLICGISAAGFADSSTPTQNAADGGWVKGACKADVEKLCPGVTPGQGKIRDCLKQHQSELSPACQSNIALAKEKIKERVEEVVKACQADQNQFCKEITPGEGRELACLKAHDDKISQGCKDALKTRHHPHAMSGEPAAPAAAK